VSSAGVDVLFSDPDFERSETAMEFRLTYEGPLQPIGNKARPDHVHAIRRKFHTQLRAYWNFHPYLRSATLSHRKMGQVNPIIKLSEHLAREYERLGYNFVPLVTESLSLQCGVDILFLRPEMPGQLVQSGDIDGRLKTIFDALRMPAQKEELGNATGPTEDEKPFYCLAADDKLISRVSVETDTLLEPTSDPPSKFDARLVVKISLKPFDMGWDNISFS
jgi:hypothetical protein